MAKTQKLSKKMNLRQFDNGYWYATEIKAFAKDIGVKATSQLRKDELEILIRKFLETGSVSQSKRNLSTPDGTKDSARGLSLELPIRKYINNKETKEFIIKSASKMDESFVEKSGARYRLNRWRENEIAIGKHITYGDLVKQFVSLCKIEGPFPQEPSGRYINFLSDYLAKEKDPSREKALKAWAELKQLDIPKNYRSWKEQS